MSWPNDADGEVLRRLEENDFNFDNDVLIDFNIDFNHWPLSNSEKQELLKLYPNCEFFDPDKEDIENGETIGYVQFQINSKLTYELVMNTQESVTNKVKQIGGWCESWGLMQE